MTEYRQVGEDLALKAQEVFKSIIDKLPNGIVILDNNGVVLFCNLATEQIFATEAKRMLGTTLGLPIQAGKRFEIDTVMQNGVGGIAEMHVEEISWENKDAYLVSFFDITDIRKAEETLKSANEQLIKLDEMKSEFVSIASHELRTPLTSIKNAVEIVLKKKTGEITEAQEKFLSMAARNIERLRAIVNDILDTSKIDAGKMELKLSSMDVEESIKSVVESYASLADKKTISFVLNMANDLPNVYGDALRVEQVITNLVSNAIKFTPNKGTLTISARLADESPDSLWRSTNFVEVSVKDTGCGMKNEDIEHIFDKFYQVDSSLARKEQHESTGLGLAISMGLVESHGGKICCESKEGEGSRFTFTLPVFEKEVLDNIELGLELLSAKKRGAHLSVLIVRIREFESPTKDFSGEELREDLNMLEEKIKRMGIKNSDKIIQSRLYNEIIMFMPDTDMVGAQAAQERIGRFINENESITCDLKLSFATFVVTYPDEGMSPDELLCSARNALNEIINREGMKGL